LFKRLGKDMTKDEAIKELKENGITIIKGLR
jgi:hypothetical protein